MVRYGVDVLLPDEGLVPWDIVLVNTLGAFLLGALVGWLGHMPSARARRQRLLWGTGALGGFTTYSALALGTVNLARAEHVSTAILLPVGSVCVGLLACGAGVALGAHTVGNRKVGS